MAEFLSAAWVAALDAATRGSDDLAVAAPFAVELDVRGGDDRLGYQVRFGPDEVRVTGRGAGVPDVVLTTDVDTAWALHQGTRRAQDAFAGGALKVSGRPELLSEHAGLLTALERVLAPVRSATTPRRAGGPDDDR